MISWLDVFSLFAFMISSVSFFWWPVSLVLFHALSRTGKTLLAKTLARFVNVPFVIADATTLTQESFVFLCWSFIQSVVMFPFYFKSLCIMQWSALYALLINWLSWSQEYSTYMHHFLFRFLSKILLTMLLRIIRVQCGFQLHVPLILMAATPCCSLQAGYVGEDVESILYKLLTVYFLLYLHVSGFCELIPYAQFGVLYFVLYE